MEAKESRKGFTGSLGFVLAAQLVAHLLSAFSGTDFDGKLQRDGAQGIQPVVGCKNHVVHLLYLHTQSAQVFHCVSCRFIPHLPGGEGGEVRPNLRDQH